MLEVIRARVEPISLGTDTIKAVVVSTDSTKVAVVFGAIFATLPATVSLLVLILLLRLHNNGAALHDPSPYTDNESVLVGNGASIPIAHMLSSSYFRFSLVHIE